MAYNKKKKDYNVEYTKKHYTRVSLLVKNDMYDEMKKAAENLDESINGFINTAISNRIDDLSKHS